MGSRGLLPADRNDDRRPDGDARPARGRRGPVGPASRAASSCSRRRAGADTGLAADADPTHRQVVRLTIVESVDRSTRPGHRDHARHVERRGRADVPAVHQPPRRRGRTADDRGRARQRLVADHGQTRAEWWPGRPSYAPLSDTAAGAPAVSGLVRGARPTRFLLADGPLSMWRPLGGEAVAAMSAVAAHAERLARGVDDRRRRDAVHGGARSDPRPRVRPGVRRGDDERRAREHPLRRRRQRAGACDGSFVRAQLPVGVGRTGNVGAETLRHLLLPPGTAPLPPITNAAQPAPGSRRSGPRDDRAGQGARAGRVPVAAAARGHRRRLRGGRDAGRRRLAAQSRASAGPAAG